MKGCMRGELMAVWVELGIIRSFTFHHFLQCDNGANIPLTKYNDAHAPIESRGWSIFREEDSPGGAPLKLMGYQVRRRVVISRMSGGGTLDIGDIGVARTGYRGRSCRGCLWYPAGTNRGRKQGAKAHFSLSRFGDYPISLTLTSLTGPGEFNTIPFRRIKKSKTTSSIDWTSCHFSAKTPASCQGFNGGQIVWQMVFRFFRLKAPPISHCATTNTVLSEWCIVLLVFAINFWYVLLTVCNW